MANKEQRRLCIIPARGGSKRIERKNIRPFEGIPVIAYSIGAALASGLFDEVMVSTDDLEIADVARDWGASVPFLRNESTSGDFATTADVISEVLDAYKTRGKEFDVLCCLYATAPFVTPQRLKEGLETMGQGSGAFTCVRYSYPPQRGLKILKDGRVTMAHPEFATARSQDLDPLYHDAGQFYFCRVPAFLAEGTLWGSDTRPVELPETEVQDLDTPLDWALAEMKYRLLSLPGHIVLEEYELTPYQELDEQTSEQVRIGRNAPDVASQMVNRDQIGPDEHKAFVASLRGRRDKAYYAVTLKESGELIGTVNITRTGAHRAERGIWLNEKARGRGHASRLLRRFYALLRQSHGIDLIETKVRLANAPSNNLEQALGAVESHRDKEFAYYVWS